MKEPVKEEPKSVPAPKVEEVKQEEELGESQDFGFEAVDMSEAKQTPIKQDPIEKKAPEVAAAKPKPQRVRPGGITVTKHDPTEKDDVPESPSKRMQAGLSKIVTDGDKLITPKRMLTPEQTKAFESELVAILKALDTVDKEFEALQKKSVEQLVT